MSNHLGYRLDSFSDFDFVSGQIIQITEIRRETLLFLGAFIAGAAFIARQLFEVVEPSDAAPRILRDNATTVVWLVTVISGIILWRFCFLFFEFCRYGYLYAAILEKHDAKLNFNISAKDAQYFSYLGFSASCVYLTLALFLSLLTYAAVLTIGNVAFPTTLAVIGVGAVVVFQYGFRELHRVAVHCDSGVVYATCSIRYRMKARCRQHQQDSLLATRKDLSALITFLSLVLVATIQNIQGLQLSAQSIDHTQLVTFGFATSLLVTTALVLNMYIHLINWETKHLKDLGHNWSSNLQHLLSYGPSGYVLCSILSTASSAVFFRELPATLPQWLAVLVLLIALGLFAWVPLLRIFIKLLADKKI